MHVLKKIAVAYRSVALVLFNTTVLLVLLNAVLSIWFSSDEPNRIDADTESYRAVYPDLSVEEVYRIIEESWVPLRYAPFTQFEERPRKGRYVNVSEHGFRITENQGPWPPDPACSNIFVFGGSTTFGYGVADEQTIASCLQNILDAKGLDRPVRVYNFGCGSHYSTQERIRFEQLLVDGFVPRAAIFIDGLNDFYFHEGVPAYTPVLRELLRQHGRISASVLQRTAIARAAHAIQRGLSPEAENSDDGSAAPPAEVYDDQPKLLKVIHRYAQNKIMTEAIARGYGVNLLFVWQPVPTYGYDLGSHLFTEGGFGKFGFTRFGYPLVKQAMGAGLLGSGFLWSADLHQDAKEPLYVDSVHYTAAMTRRFGEAIAAAVLERELLEVAEGATEAGDRR